MAVRRLHPDQPASFEFTPENLAWARETIAKYPDGKQASAVIPLLWRAQEQHAGWLPEPAIRYVGDMLDMAYIRVYEVATFYTMFQLGPVGKKAHIQVCGTTPCMLRGSEALIDVCKRRISSAPHKISSDGDFSWEEVECLGVCANAPMVQIWKDTYEDLTPELLEKVLDGFASGNLPKPGSQIGRTASAPIGALTSLTDASIYLPRQPAPEQSVSAASADAAVAEPAAKAEPSPALDDAARPPALEAARGGRADDLKRISGVGPKLEETLNSLGIYHFDQVAAWTPEAVAWIDGFLSFKGRVDREGWIEQAKKLASAKS
ncbi:MAG TPA: NADH-quinone oxidoreductase subunit NuoE [Hyphomicrobiaceae bacterium]|nr:NADH-quinone oxidoreductase subunit NuoE [Hyphomicrobiaceae bacterium]